VENDKEKTLNFSGNVVIHVISPNCRDFISAITQALEGCDLPTEHRILVYGQSARPIPTHDGDDIIHIFRDINPPDEDRRVIAVIEIICWRENDANAIISILKNLSGFKNVAFIIQCTYGIQFPY